MGQSQFDQEFLTQMGVEAEDFAANRDFFGSLDIDPAGYVEWVFDKHGQAGMQKPTRFTDGSIPVLYTASEAATAFAEKAQWLSPLPSMSYFQQLVRVDVHGATKDLRTINPQPACLTAEAATGAYAACFEVTKEAIAEGLEGFHTPSARMHGGSCTPILNRAAVTAIKFVQHVRFDYSEVDKRWQAILL